MSVNGFRVNGTIQKYNYNSLDNIPKLEMDKTLTEEGVPADAKATGDRIRNLQSLVGSPLVASTASRMTDTSKIYVYTGSETGYTYGNWYYHNGTSWVSGGVYNSLAVDLDTTLTITGKAADAKAVGDNLDQKVSIKTSPASAPDLDITDSSGNVIARFEGGHIKTKEFDSSEQTDTVQKIWTGTCETSASTAVKIVALDNPEGFSLVKGVTIAVFFSYANAAVSPKLNVNGTGAIDVRFATSDAIYALQSPYHKWGVGTKYFTYIDSNNGWVQDFPEMSAIEEIASSKADKNSPTFEGVPKAPTASSGTNNTQIATTAFVQQEITGMNHGLIRSSASSTADLDVTDNSGNVIARFEGGHIKTKEFDSSAIVYQPLKGKKWTCIGDSLTEANVRTTMHYHDYIAELTGINVVNHGHSGAGYYARSFDYAFMNEVQRIPTDSDVITIFGSINDIFSGERPIGNITDTDTSTLCGCINITIDNLYARIPVAYLGIVTPTPCWYQADGSVDDWTPSNPGNDLETYSEALIGICRRRSIPCLDLYHESNLRPQIASFRTLTYSKDSGNGIHPDETGHKLIAARFLEFIKTLILN